MSSCPYFSHEKNQDIGLKQLQTLQLSTAPLQTISDKSVETLRIKIRANYVLDL